MTVVKDNQQKIKTNEGGETWDGRNFDENIGHFSSKLDEVKKALQNTKLEQNALDEKVQK